MLTELLVAFVENYEVKKNFTVDLSSFKSEFLAQLATLSAPTPYYMYTDFTFVPYLSDLVQVVTLLKVSHT